MVFKDLYKTTCFFSKKTLFLSKKTWQKHMVFMVDKTKQKLLSENYECFSKKEIKCQELTFAADTYLWATYGCGYSPYEPGFDQSIIKIFVQC